MPEEVKNSTGFEIEVPFDYDDPQGGAGTISGCEQ